MSANMGKRLFISVLTIAVLLMGLGVTTLALASVTRQIGGGFFSTGTVKGNLNGGVAVLSAGDGEELKSLEPGQWLERSFYVENVGTQDAYYKLFFEEISGELQNAIEVQILRADNAVLIYKGILGEMTRENMLSTDDYLVPLERRTLTIRFKICDSAGSEHGGRTLSFRMSADFTQVKNNDNREF